MKLRTSLLPTLLTVLFLGCWQSKYVYYHDVITEPSSKWGEHDARMVIEANMEFNKFDFDSPVRVVATPFNPLVITAINREDQRRKNWSEVEFLQSLQEDLHRYLGMSIDTSTGLVLDAEGTRYKNEMQLDSLLFLISVIDKYETMIISKPDFVRNVSELKEQIYLQNDRNQFVKPNWVGGDGNGKLLGNERLVVMFQLNFGNYHFFEDSRTMTLVVQGFERDIKLTFPLFRDEE